MTKTLSTAEWGAKQDPPIKAARVRQLCEEVPCRIPGAEKLGRDWRIPEDAPKPLDERRTNG